MKVLFVIPDITTSGGVEKVVASLTSYLTDVYHHDITILTCLPFDNECFFELHPEVQVHSLSLSAYPEGKWQKLKWYYHLQHKLSLYLRAHNFDFIFAHGAYVSACVNWAETGAVKIGCMHVDFHATHGLFRQLGGLMLRKLDALVVLTANDKRNYDTFLKKVYVIPNFIKEVPLKFSDQSKHVLVGVGRLERQKGFDLLVSAFALVHNQHPEWQLIVYGEGTERKYLEGLVETKRMQGKILLPGKTKELHTHLKNAAIFVLSSRYEGFPLSLLEAMSFGLCCVSFDVDGATAVLQNNENGFLVEQGRVLALANVISTAISDQELRKKIGMKARATAKEYELSQIGVQWQILIEQFKRTD